MGLDMYLFDKNNKELAYWRKSNQIHGWFVKNVQRNHDTCNCYRVFRGKLELLLKTCEEVLNKSKLVNGKVVDHYEYKDGKKIPHYIDGQVIENPSVAKKLLPTYAGFFFGSYDYDNYYYSDLEYTIKTLKEILSTFDFKNDKLYYHSWW